jgi:DNA-directed RNA polymerase subunit RPC12/RpoP
MKIRRGFSYTPVAECREHCYCGHVVYIPAKDKSMVCEYCGRTIFNKSKARFLYMLSKEGIGVKDNGKTRSYTY